jgi:hypothetical protein
MRLQTSKRTTDFLACVCVPNTVEMYSRSTQRQPTQHALLTVLICRRTRCTTTHPALTTPAHDTIALLRYTRNVCPHQSLHWRVMTFHFEHSLSTRESHKQTKKRCDSPGRSQCSVPARAYRQRRTAFPYTTFRRVNAQLINSRIHKHLCTASARIGPLCSNCPRQITCGFAS